MRNKSRLAGALSLVTGVVGMGGSSFGVVLYDSGGFERSAGYISGQDLTGQPAGSGVNAWRESAASSNNPPYPYAGVINYTASTQQLVGVADTNIGPNDHGFWYPGTNIASPFTPSGATNHVVVSWTEAYTSATGNPFYGIQAYDGSSSVALAGIDTTNNLLVVQSPTNTQELGSNFFSFSPGTYYNFTMDLNYTAQTYGVYVNGALIDSEAFANPETQFTDADITTYVLGTGNANGVGYYDNYIVTAQSSVPEPASISLLIAAPALLLKRRRSILVRENSCAN